jgi:hypothetical protein
VVWQHINEDITHSVNTSLVSHFHSFVTRFREVLHIKEQQQSQASSCAYCMRTCALRTRSRGRFVRTYMCTKYIPATAPAFSLPACVQIINVHSCYLFLLGKKGAERIYRHVSLENPGQKYLQVKNSCTVDKVLNLKS